MPGKITINFSGDICPLNGYSRIFQNSLVDSFFVDVIKIIEKSDFHVTNLEVPLSVRGEPIAKSGPNLRAAPSVINGLKQLKVTHACLANNHIMDFGSVAALDTLRHLQENDIVPAGLVEHPDQGPLPVVLIEKNGVKVRLINAAEGEFSVPENDKPGAVFLRESDILKLLYETREDPYHNVLFLHGGREYKYLPPTFLRKMYRSFIDAGAATVIGHHPHVPQGIEEYKGHPIYYSLGNFVFDISGMKSKSGTYCFYMVQMEFSGNKIIKHKLIPLEKKHDLCVIPMKGKRRQQFLDFMNSISLPLHDEKLAVRIWKQYLREDAEIYLKHLRKALNTWNSEIFDKREHLTYLQNVLATCRTHQENVAEIMKMLNRDEMTADQNMIKIIDSWQRCIDKLIE